MKLSPHHIFIHEQKHYFINIDEMSVHQLSPASADLLQHIKTNIQTCSKTKAEALLNELDLVVEDRTITKEISKKATPEEENIVSLAFFVSQECNQKCVYCYGDGGGYGTSGFMKKEIAFAACDRLFKTSAPGENVYIGFMGGEPLLNVPLIKDIVEYAENAAKKTKNHINFSIFTNASLLDETILSFIEKKNIAVSVSFDGPPEIQNIQRPLKNGKPSYDQILPKLKQLLSLFPESSCRATVFETTDTAMVEAALKKVGFKNTDLVLAAPSYFAGKRFPYDPKKLLQGIEKEAESFQENIKNRNIEYFNQRKVKGLWGRTLRTAVELFTNRKRRFYRCLAGRHYLAVSCSGDVYPCHRLVGVPDYKLGHILDPTPFSPLYHQPNFIAQDKCHECYAKYSCLGGCFHENLGTTGDIFETDNRRCVIEKRLTELAAVISYHLTPEDKQFLTQNRIISTLVCPFDLKF